MKLHATLNIYNDRQFLPACIESLAEYVDSFIVADGAYQLYYEEYKKFDKLAQPWSTDGSLEILHAVLAQSGSPTLNILRKPQGECWLNQTEKRTAILDAVPKGDWFIIIDADEMLMGDIAEGMEAIYDSGCIVATEPIYAPGADIDRFKREWHPRIFKKVDGMHYWGTHWHLRDKHGRIMEEKYPVYAQEKIVLIHFKVFKTQSRQIPHSNYMINLAERGYLEPADLGKVLMSGITRKSKVEEGKPEGVIEIE